jgi:hypothetical protein
MDDTTEHRPYAELSRQYADGGDLRLAALAAWTADVHALEALIWESGLDGAPDPLAELAALGDSVAASLEDAVAMLPAEPVSLRAVVEAAREAMVSTFDESVHGLLADRLEPLAHLDDARAAALDGHLGDRLGGRSTEELVTELHAAAADCAALAALLAAEGELDAADRQADQADSAAFEAYLVQAAARAGDDGLATVDLRWDLAAAAFHDARLDRDRLVGLLGTAEQDVLRRLLEPLHR